MSKNKNKLKNAMSVLDFSTLDFRIDHFNLSTTWFLKISSNNFTLFLTNYVNVNLNVHNCEGKTASLLVMS